MLMRIGSLMFAIPVVVLLVAYSIDMSYITDCEQQGLYYSPASGECSSDKDALTTYYSRHTILVNLSILLATIGSLVMTWGMILKGLTRPSEER